MNFPPRLTSFAWVIALLCAGGLLIWMNAIRAGRVHYISGLAGVSPVVAAASPTGYADGLRRMVAPEHNNDSYQWIAQTQLMLGQNQWHLRHVGYDNAPIGREVYSASAYRWWLGLIAGIDRLVSGQPLGLAVERAALYADPLLHLLLLIGVAIFAARHFGNLAAALLALGTAALFPFAGSFLPGQPNDYGLGLACIAWSILPLLAAVNLRARAGPDAAEATRFRRGAERLFFLAGVAGGIGIWVAPSRQVPILLGVLLGAIFAALLARRAVVTKPSGAIDPALWRSWSLGGAGAVLLTFLFENYPDHLSDWRIETVHPLYGVAWLGAAALLERLAQGGERKSPAWTRREIGAVAVAVIATVALPILMWKTGNRGFLAVDAQGPRLTNLPESPVASTFFAWILRDGFNAAVWATILPGLLLLPAIWRLVRAKTDPVDRTALVLVLGPVLIALGFACFQLRWWSTLDVTLLTLLVAGLGRPHSSRSKASAWLWSATFTLSIVSGLTVMLAQTQAARSETVTAGEVESLIERDLAYWLANQSGPNGAVVLAPPNLTTSLYFHGGLSGVGTTYAENSDGFAAMIRIAFATSPDEGQTLAHGRNLTYLVIPSWDNYLEEYARLESMPTEHSLLVSLQRLLPPRWLKPVPYHLPNVAGDETRSVLIFQVVDTQDNVTALSHLAEYFVEMEQLDQAHSVGQALTRLFPADLGALVARARVERARENQAGLMQVVNELLPFISRGDDSALAWDRRVSLAIALTEGKKFEQAREQVQRCLADLDEARLRSLTTVSLFRLQVMIKAFKLAISDPQLRDLARKLLPVEYRDRL